MGRPGVSSASPVTPEVKVAPDEAPLSGGGAGLELQSPEAEDPDESFFRIASNCSATRE